MGEAALRLFAAIWIVSYPAGSSVSAAGSVAARDLPAADLSEGGSFVALRVGTENKRNSF
jgi:hypothetical protein